MKQCKTCKYWDTNTSIPGYGEMHPCIAADSDYHGDARLFGMKMIALGGQFGIDGFLLTDAAFGCVEHQPVEHNPFDTAK
jgi:hypothetical protein